VHQDHPPRARVLLAERGSLGGRSQPIEQPSEKRRSTHLDHPGNTASRVPLGFDLVVTDGQLTAMYGISYATLKRMRAAGKAPPRVQLSPRRFGTRLSAAERWLQEANLMPLGTVAPAGTNGG